jgi:hypothetical protein
MSLFSRQIGEPEIQLPECLIRFPPSPMPRSVLSWCAAIGRRAEIEARGPFRLENFDQREFELIRTILHNRGGRVRRLAYIAAMTMEQAIAYEKSNDND